MLGAREVLLMPRRSAVSAANRWQIRSVAVRARDGPPRVGAAYRLLLAETPLIDLNGRGERLPLERPAARRDLRPRLDRAPGPRADH